MAWRISLSRVRRHTDRTCRAQLERANASLVPIDPIARVLEFETALEVTLLLGDLELTQLLD